MPLTPVSLAYTNEEKRNMGRPMTEGPPVEEMNDYPFVCIYLSTAELRKLGYGRGQLNVGDKVNFVGKGFIKGARAEMVNTLESYTADLQITDLALEKEAEEDTKADQIYGGNRS